jgi:hypothetical protein
VAQVSLDVVCARTTVRRAFPCTALAEGPGHHQLLGCTRRPSCEELAAQNTELRAMVETLQAQVAELTARLGQSSQNSSTHW